MARRIRFNAFDIYPTEYVPGTLRNALFERGDRLPPEHRGARYRLGGPGSTVLPDEVSRNVAGELITWSVEAGPAGHLPWSVRA